jgi:two-component system, sensor histidine kinase and response regulator
LEQLRRDFGSDIKPTLEKFLDKLPYRLDAISDAINKGDPNSLSKAAHKLKGAAATFGTERLADISRQFEMIGKSDQIPDDGKLLAAIMAEGDAVQAEITKILDKT